MAGPPPAQRPRRPRLDAAIKPRRSSRRHRWPSQQAAATRRRDRRRDLAASTGARPRELEREGAVSLRRARALGLRTLDSGGGRRANRREAPSEGWHASAGGTARLAAAVPAGRPAFEHAGTVHLGTGALPSASK
eukprot:14553146-Alexandrium_andersonii.AAC.1